MLWQQYLPAEEQTQQYLFAGVVVSNNQILSSMDGMPGIETKNNLGASIGLSITINTITGIAIWLLCNNGCTYGSTISGNTLSGNAGTGNFCNGMIQEDDLGGNNIINCWWCFFFVLSHCPTFTKIICPRTTGNWAVLEPLIWCDKLWCIISPSQPDSCLSVPFR